MLRYALTFLLIFAPSAGAALNADRPFRTLLVRLATALGAMLAFYALRRFPYGKKELHNAIAIGFLALYFILSLFDMASFFLSGRAFDFEFYYHFNLNTMRYGLGGFGWHIAAAVAWVTGTLAALITLWRKYPAAPFRPSYYLLAAGLALLFTPEGALHAALKMHQRVKRASAAVRLEETKLKEYGIKLPRFHREQLYARPGKNLVMVYLEGFENGHIDPKNFPELLPNICRLLNEEALRFTNVEQPRHGNFTLAGIFASMTGSVFCDAHLLRANEHDEGGAHGYDVTLGDDLATVPYLLHLAGYYQSFMLGHNPNFAGTNVFLARERYDESLHAEVLLPPEECDKEQWGMRDRRLFEFAARRFEELAAEKRPFALTVLTIDGHNPSGFVEPDGPVYRRPGQPDLQILTALHATDQHFGRFIERLKQSPAWENTVVVVTSDHLSRNTAVAPVVMANPKRRLITFALNAGSRGIMDEHGKIFDLAPTVLALMGVEHNGEFLLGENLFDSPDPARLRGDSAEAEDTLLAANRRMSRDRLEENPIVKIIETPYPALEIGGRRIPLFERNSGAQSLPAPGECFAVRIGPDRRIDEYKRLSPASEARNFLKKPGSYIVLAGAQIAVELVGEKQPGLLLLSGRPGAWNILGGQ